jgi:hypothetical protein
LLANTSRTSPYQQVAVTGTNFGASEPVNVYWDSLHTKALTTTVTSSVGSFSASFTAPQAISGTHTLIAVGLHTYRYALATITVHPELFVAPASGTAGSKEVTIGFGFGAAEAVKEYWDTPLTPLGATTSNTLGSFYGASAITSTVPLRATTGQHYLYGVGQTSQALGIGRFYVHS